MKTRTAIEQL